MREKTAEGLLIVSDSLGLKAISTEIVLCFIGYSIEQGPALYWGYKPNFTSRNLFKHFSQSCKRFFKMLKWKSQHIFLILILIHSN